MIRALLGGSFDPVHAGHMAMARHVLSANMADTVHVVPAWMSPHKTLTVATGADRLAMVRLAFSGFDHVFVDSREMDSGRPCYSVDTLTSLVDEYDGDSWLLVIGGDNLDTLQSWHQPERLQTLATIVVLGRGGRDLSPQAVRAVGLDPARVLGLPGFDQVVSSTAVRAMLADGPFDVNHLVAKGIPAAVAQYILAHQLYLPDRNGETRVPDSD